MNIQCQNCNRTFDLDEKKIVAVAAAKCVCGQRLALKVDPKDGQRLGKYRLVHRIAVGGMGEIYYGKVVGVEGFEKEVAIKKMLAHLSADRAFIDMMIKEAKLTVKMVHPNIVGVYDLAKEGNEYYIAMEYVPGVTIASILENTIRNAQAQDGKPRLPVEVAVHIVLNILKGLAYAHNLPTSSGERMTILHRDITPQNILITARGWVKIADFGIAKAVNEITTTSPGMIKGKLGYIAPEQLTGKEPDQRLDIFCAGILLYEMLTVRRLFKGTSEVDTFRMISECKIPPLVSVRPDVLPSIEQVMLQALTANPDDRFSRAEDFYSALSAAIFPRTPDDYAETTLEFFTQHPEYFASLSKVTEASADAEDTSTRVVALPGSKDDVPEVLEAIATYFRDSEGDLNEVTRAFEARERTRSSNMRASAFTVVAMLLLGGVGTALWLGGRMSQQPDSVAVAATKNGAGGGPMGQAPSPAGAPRVGVASALGQGGNARARAEVPAAPRAPADAGSDPSADAAEAPERAGSTNAAPRVSRPVADAGPPKPLSGSEISQTLQRSSGAIARCVANAENRAGLSDLVASLTIDPTGKVSETVFEPVPGDAKVAECLSHALKNVRFRRHASEMKVKFPLRFQVM